jgi:hypothetical protein
MTMREIQELTLSRAREAQLIGQRFFERHELFHQTTRERAQASSLPVNAVRVTLAPVAPDLYTGRLFGHPKIKPFYGVQKAKIGSREVVLQLPSLTTQPRPILRGVRYKNESREVTVCQDILENGVVDYWLLDVVHEKEYDALYPEWIMGLAVNALLTANRVRQESGSPGAEYGMELEVLRQPDSYISLAGYGSSSRVYVAGKLPNPTTFPRLSLLDKSDAVMLLSILNRDLWNTIGTEPENDLELVIPVTLLE